MIKGYRTPIGSPHLAFAPLFSRMRHLMDLAGMRFAKGLPTVLTGKVPNLLVHNLHVAVQGALRMGGMVAYVALKLLLLGVREDVLAPLLARGLAHTTVGAHVVLDACVPEEMVLQSAVDVEALAANVTRIRKLLASVLVHVLLESHRTAENHTALPTRLIRPRSTHSRLVVHLFQVDCQQAETGKHQSAPFHGAGNLISPLGVRVVHVEAQGTRRGEACDRSRRIRHTLWNYNVQYYLFGSFPPRTERATGRYGASYAPRTSMTS